jgi:hypothetical protein
MGLNAIERGNTDSWTAHPRHIAAVEEALRSGEPAGGGAQAPGGGRGGRATKADYERLVRAPELRDPRGYIITADQPDFLTAAKFVDALLETGIDVKRATRSFSVNGKTYPAGSFVVKTAQAFAPHVYDMFEPQDHPDDIPYPGAAPTPPYDNAGWTLAFQMGVQFDRILEGFDGPFETIKGMRAPRPEGRVAKSARAYLLSHEANDAFKAVNALLAKGQQVYWLKQPLTTNGKTYPAGTFYINATKDTRSQLESIARETGLTFDATSAKPSGEQYRLAAGAGCTVRPLRRHHAVRLDALCARAVRLPVPARVPEGARCREPERKVRRHHFPRRQHPRECGQRPRRRRQQ